MELRAGGITYLISEESKDLSKILRSSALQWVLLNCSENLLTEIQSDQDLEHINLSVSLNKYSHVAGNEIFVVSNPWAVDSPPSIPEFKKQIMVPFIEESPQQEPCIGICSGTDISIAKAFMLLDILSRQVVSPDEYAAVNSSLLPWTPNQCTQLFLDRCSSAVRRQLAYNFSLIQSKCAMNDTLAFPDQASSCVKPLPSAACGLKVYEFFSGIGGMHLSLPAEVRDLPITSITAFDCSDVANEVYRHNFLRSKRRVACALREVAIEGVKQHELDGDSAADIWTMSPPCQPYTKTRGARQLGAKDNRNRGFFHLMDLLLRLALKPRWIFLENVAPSADSEVMALFKRVLAHCGFSLREYLISPVDLGIPNHRRRYYLAAEYGVRFALGASPLQTLADSGTIAMRRLEEFMLAEEAMEEAVRSQLLISDKQLSKEWAPSRIAIVGRHDTASHCFTKGYGKILDKATGACYLIDAAGPLADKDFSIDRSQLSSLSKRLRLFHPGTAPPQALHSER